MAELSDETIVQRMTCLVAADVGNERIAILHQTTGNYYLFNRTGSNIWSLIAEPKTIDAIARALVDQYDIDDQTCRITIREFLERMETNGLVKLTERATTNIA